MPDVTIYTELVTKMITKYGKHRPLVMWETFEVMQGEHETAITLFDHVELLKM